MKILFFMDSKRFETALEASSEVNQLASQLTICRPVTEGDADYSLVYIYI